MAYTATLYRRHLQSCKHRKKGRNFSGCSCPVWIDRIVDGKRRLESCKTTRWEKAERLKAAYESGQTDKPEKSLREAIAAWDSYLVGQRLRGSSLEKYRRLTRQLQAWCDGSGYIALRQITVEVLDGFRATRSSLAAITAVKELQALRGFFAFCHEREWCTSNPAKRIRTPKLPDNQIVPYTPEEIAAIIAACDRVGQQPYERLRARALVLLLRHTALRISDALMLRKDQVRNGTVTLFTKKTGQRVLLPIPVELEVALDSLPLPKPLERDNGYFFWNGERSGKRLLNCAERLLTSVFSKAGVKDATAHRFRHTLATELLGRGASEQDVADILGNSPAIVRKHYGKWSQARQNRIFDLMRAYQSPSPDLHDASRDFDTRKIHEHSQLVN